MRRPTRVNFRKGNMGKSERSGGKKYDKFISTYPRAYNLRTPFKSSCIYKTRDEHRQFLDRINKCANKPYVEYWENVEKKTRPEEWPPLIKDKPMFKKEKEHNRFWDDVIEYARKGKEKPSEPATEWLFDSPLFFFLGEFQN